VESNIRKESTVASTPAENYQLILSRPLDYRPLENDFVVAAKKPMSSRQGGGVDQLETVPSHETLRANPVTADAQIICPHPLAWRWAQATPDKTCNRHLKMKSFSLTTYSMRSKKVFSACRDLNFNLTLSTNARRRHGTWNCASALEITRGRRFRHQRKRIVIAKLRLLRRQQSERHFPAVTLGRTEIAPGKASAGIEQVDVNTPSLSSSFLGSIQCYSQLHYNVSVNSATHEGVDEDPFRDTSQYFRHKLGIHKSRPNRQSSKQHPSCYSG
jgi:hypothetical protein